MARAVRDFAERLRGPDVAAVFYAGHGLQLNGENYLVPIDARIGSAADVRFNSRGGRAAPERGLPSQTVSWLQLDVVLNLHAFRLRRHGVDLAHVAVVHGRQLTIVPGDRDGVPARGADGAAVSRIPPPADAVAPLEVLGFRNGHDEPLSSAATSFRRRR